MSAHLGNRIPAAHINPMNERFPLKDTIEEGLCLFRWKVGVFKREKEIIHTEKDVLIIRKKEALQYQVIDTATKVCSFGPIPIPPTSTIDLTINHLSQCEVTVLGDSPTFAKPYHRWKTNQKIISLLPYNDVLFWQIFETKEKPTIRLSFDLFTKVTEQKCTEATKKLFQECLNIRMSKEEQATFIKKFNILSLRTSTRRPKQILVSPINVPSQIDDRYNISYFSWAVTLVAHGGSNGNHTQIIIEGLDKDGYFMHLAEFNREGEINSKRMEHKLKYEERTTIWMASSDKIERMLGVIELEKNPQMGPRFSKTGSKSIFSKDEHNCFTWAREKLLSIGINPGESIWDVFIARPKYYMHKESYFLKMDVSEQQL